MTDYSIPVAVSGPGSQPGESDGTELDILQMPSGMSSYATPAIPEPEDARQLDAAKNLLCSLQAELQRHQLGSTVAEFDLGFLNPANRRMVDQVLGEGEVSVVFSGRVKARIQESVLAGVWRVKYLSEDDTLLRDVIEVGMIPGLVTGEAFINAADKVSTHSEGVSPGVLNAPPLLAEINDQLGAFEPGNSSHVINLTLLPQTEEDLAFLADRLGEGSVTILSRGYGNCRITSTATNHVWWVQYFNSQDKNILNSLEITQVPNVACAAQEDIQDSAERLQEIMEIYQ